MPVPTCRWRGNALVRRCFSVVSKDTQESIREERDSQHGRQSEQQMQSTKMTWLLKLPGGQARNQQSSGQD